jgi:ERCC4-related helicase
LNEALQFFARLPIDAESHFISKTSIFAQTPKWYQFKLRSLQFGNKHWLECLSKELGFERRRMILADEGGVGKTKSASICANYLLNQDSSDPVLILVEPRQRKSWYHKLRKVLPRHQHIIWRGSATNLMSPRRDVVYVCSKYSVHKHIDVLKGAWGDQEQFSLVIIDECHKMKPGGNEKRNFNAEKRNFNAEKQVCRAANYVIGITASPLGIEIGDVWDIGKKLGIPESRMEFFRPPASKSNEYPKAWNKWIQLNEQGGYRETIERYYQQPDSIDQQEWDKFIEKYANDIFEILPINNKNRKLFKDRLSEFNFADKSLLFELLGELNPFSPCMCITLRSDLGVEAESIFRKMRVKTIECLFNNKILQQLNEQTNSLISRQLHSHPNVHYRLPDDPKTHSLISNGDTFDDPRIQELLKLFQAAIKKRSGSECIGAVIFAEWLDSVDSLVKTLEQRWDELEWAGKKPRLVVQKIIGETEDTASKQYINDEGGNKYPFARNEGEFHVVVGTSAIEQGVDMPWANILIHWDMPYNPRRLEQRTWRLDRHNEESYTSEFEVIYFWTGYIGLERQIEIMGKRVEKYDNMLGRSTEPGLWPQTCNLEYVRSYAGSSKAFVHEESQRLAERWKTISTSTIGLIEAQQIELFRCIAQECKVELETESLNKGRLKLVLQDLPSISSQDNKGRLALLKSNSSLHRLRKLALHADGHDHEAIAELSSRRNHDGGASWLGIDGYQQPLDAKRSRMVRLNPRGQLIRTMLRDRLAKHSLCSQTTNDNLRMIFSLDPIQHDEKDKKPYRPLDVMMSEILSERNHCNLYLANGDNEDSRQLTFEDDENWLLELINNQTFLESKKKTLSVKESDLLYSTRNEIFEKTREKFQNTYDEDNKLLNETISEISSLGQIESEDEELREYRLNQRMRNIKRRLNRIGKYLDYELSQKTNYEPHVRYYEVNK